MSVLAATAMTDPSALEADTGCCVWWLGQAGFLVAIGGKRIVIDPYLSDSLAEKYKGTTFPHTRMMPPPVLPSDITGIDFVLATHAHTDHLDPGTLPDLLAANPDARLVVPRAEKTKAIARGATEDRIITIDIGEAIDLGGVILTATPSAHEDLVRTDQGYPYLGYALSDGAVTLWHSGDCVPHPALIDWIRPLQVDLALLPVNGRDARRAGNGVPGNFTLDEAIALTDSIGARAMIGHHFGLFDFNTIDPVEARRHLATGAHRADIRLAETSTCWRIGAHAKTALSVLLVCRGNICRSPTAHGLLARLLPGHRVDSAAIMDWNVGKPPEPTTIGVALDRGLDISGLRARQITPGDHGAFDLIYAVDASIAQALERSRPDGAAPVGQLGHFAHPERDPDISDPWGHERSVFEDTYDTIEEACRRLAVLIHAGLGTIIKDREDGHGFRR